MRTLESKISDGGPYNQRINPHVLTIARKELQETNIVLPHKSADLLWYRLAETPRQTWEARLAEQEPIHQALQAGSLTSRMGQALEIAVFKALKTQSSLEFFGRFRDLDAHDDSQLYSKEEPPNYIGIRETPTDQRLDFLVRHPEAGWAGIEVKNIREWLYPNRVEIIDFLYKCTVLDAVPVLIARRFPWVTFHVLGICGVVVHQNYNQLLPVADSPLADQAKHKRLLGYHDIRLGNEPDARLVHFIHDNLPKVLPSAREKFDEYKDLLAAFAAREMDYDEFAGRVRRRNQGLPEDADYNIGDYDY